MARVYESNGPDVKIRGNPSHIAEKYVQLARDAQSSGDPIAAENYYQHAEHYFRLIAAAQEQFRQNNPHCHVPKARRAARRERRAFEDGDDERQQPRMGGRRRALSARASRSPTCRATRNLIRTQQHQPHTSSRSSRASAALHEGAGDVDRLPSFITGGAAAAAAAITGHKGQNGHDNQPDRFPLHRRRRRHRGGPRHDTPGRLAPGRAVTAATNPRRAASEQSAAVRNCATACLSAPPPGDRRQRRLERRHQPRALAPSRNRAIDLFGRLDDVNAGERRGDDRARPLPGHRRAQEPAARDRRHMERLPPSGRREPGLAQQMRDLRARIWPAVAERRRVHARPHPAPIRHHHQQPPAAPPARARPPAAARPGHAPFRARARAARGRSTKSASGNSSSSTSAARPGRSVGHFTTPCAAGMKARQRSASSRNRPR